MNIIVTLRPLLLRADSTHAEVLDDLNRMLDVLFGRIAFLADPALADQLFPDLAGICLSVSSMDRGTGHYDVVVLAGPSEESLQGTFALDGRATSDQPWLRLNEASNIAIAIAYLLTGKE